MSRRRRAERRPVQPDPLYGSELLSKFINKLMIGGKRSTARAIVYRALESFAKKVNASDPLEAFSTALNNARPSLEVKSRRIGGATYQVPIEIAPERGFALAMRWLIDNARSKAGRAMDAALSMELSETYNNTGPTIKKKDDTHRMAEANKAFAHYKW